MNTGCEKSAINLKFKIYKLNFPVQRRIFYAWDFSCLRALKDLIDKLDDDENFSRDGVDVDIVNLRVQTIRKIGRHLQVIDSILFD